MEWLRSFTCKSLLSLATTVWMISAPAFALAQDQTESRHVPAAAIARDEQKFLIYSDLAISKMSLGMTAEATGDVDRDFVAMMMPHQQGAIDVARAELKYGHNEELRRLARDIIAAREHEISAMHDVIGQLLPAQIGEPPQRISTSERPSSTRKLEK